MFGTVKPEFQDQVRRWFRDLFVAKGFSLIKEREYPQLFGNIEQIYGSNDMRN